MNRAALLGGLTFASGIACGAVAIAFHSTDAQSFACVAGLATIMAFLAAAGAASEELK